VQPGATGVRVGDAERADFRDRGFLVVEALTTPDELVALRPAYDRLFEAGAVEARDRIELSGRDLPQVLSPEHYAPELQDSVAWRRAEQLARDLLGPDTVATGMHAIRKPGGSGAETPWHQDEAYWDPARDHDALSIWVPLQDVSEDNGCMQFQPGDHRREVLEHRRVDADSVGLVLTDLSAVTDPVACPLRLGGATVHAGRTLHYTGPNRSPEPRRALIMSFCRPSQPRERPRSFPWQTTT
jgi:hypothetical protein